GFVETAGEDVFVSDFFAACFRFCSRHVALSWYRSLFIRQTSYSNQQTAKPWSTMIHSATLSPTLPLQDFIHQIIDDVVHGIFVKLVRYVFRDSVVGLFDV